MTADPEKIKAIVEFPKPTNIHEVRSFHGLVTFYRQLIRGFSIVMAPITDYIRKGEFHWTHSITKAFKEIRSRMADTHIMRLLDLSSMLHAMYQELA